MFLLIHNLKNGSLKEIISPSTSIKSRVTNAFLTPCTFAELSKCHETMAQYPIFQLLEGLVISSEEKIIKPDQAIYEHFAEIKNQILYHNQS